MLQNRLRAFMVTTQAISFATETVVPWLTRRAKVGAANVQKKMHRESSSDEEDHAKEGAVGQDSAEAQRFLKRVEKQVALPEYDVNEDYAEMVLQLRSDAAKISYNARRPIPSRTDTIGPWIDNLHTISWFSSLTNASILYLFHGTMDNHAHGGPRLGLGMLLLCILVSEHAYLALRSLAGLVLDSIPTDAELK
ncbi:hypothetical protein BGZ74_006005, partial [Mortierella antarctica]